MILKGKQRAHGRQLGNYLLKIGQNEHVEIHELRGFVTNYLPSALSEVDAISKGTRAKQPFFSLSMNPPPSERVSIKAFEAAIEQIEQKLELDDQPRAIVFHEKEGRRHAHVVWSRIDTAEMKAINLPFFKMKLKDVSRELYLEHDWKMPPGLADRKDRNPLNYSREEWQQARRVGLNPKDIKRIFQDCWAVSDSRKAFEQALLAQGFVLARGDRRGYVALDYQGEVYVIAKYTGVRTKAVRERLGDPLALPMVEQAKAQISDRMAAKLRQYLKDAENEKQNLSAALEFKRLQLVERQRSERQHLEQMQSERWEAETNVRAKRLVGGLKGVWHVLTGKHAKVRRQNELETLLAMQRDRAEKDNLIFKHIEQHQQLSQRQRNAQYRHKLEIEELRQDIYQYREMKSGKLSKLREDFLKTSEKPKRSLLLEWHRKRGRGFEPEI
ncbi:relaxase/mobilization nuclease domain-containing protein [Candidatus Thiodiazotropha sp. LNASS1]|uniref:relaxase/mobilization nuclease domain-containing protein n=1 Tax=Candidatus Thiodiazotropha sp. LNASS1 TaxID=3096260 RepID=UPI0034DFA6DB